MQVVTDQNIEKLSQVDGIDCSDQWSKIDLTSATDQMNESTSLIASSTIFLSVVIAFILLIELGLFCFKFVLSSA